ncbi:energy transducer TonB family protein, partial [Rubellimicrobium arenae]|uniref:energy transducer TonB family protein n=1 Tax=Rubellimicrobium arenae TaxID=2817372 RepID=UPI001B30906F
IAWLLLGWGLDSPPLDFQLTPVTAVSGEEFALAVAASMAPVAAAPVSVTERTQAVGATLRQGDGAEDLVAGVERTADVQPTSVAPVPPVTAKPVAPTPRVQSAAPAPVQPVDPVRPEAPAPAQRPEPAREVASAEPVRPVAPTEVTEALPDESSAPPLETAPRPPERPDDLAAQPEPEPVAQAEPEREPVEPLAAPPQGAADARTTRGAQAGEAAGTAVAQGQATAAPGPSAAASNYPGQVMQRLSRTRRDRISSSGTAVIAFSVSDSGTLASLGVAQSSGVAEVDQAGLALVQRAAPFPAPPAGAQRSFSFQFTGN